MLGACVGLARRHSKKICLALLLPLVMFIGLAAWEGYQEYQAISFETAYFEELERLDQLDREWKTFSKMNLSEMVEEPPSFNNRLRPLFPDLVQLKSWSFNQQLRLHEDGTCHFPQEHVWIYFAGKRTCPSSDGLSMCEDFIDAFDRVIQYHHVRGPAAGAFLSFVDCDVSTSLCTQLGVESNIMVNMQSKSPCKSHMPDKKDPKLRWYCPVIWRFIGLPLEKMPTRSIQVFPSAYEQLLSLTSVDGFIDAIDPIDGEKLYLEDDG